MGFLPSHSDETSLKLLYYTPFFGEPLTEIGGFTPHEAEDLCTITTNHNSLAHADAVVFHIPDFRSFPPFKPPKQLWVAMSVESDANYPLQCIPEFMSQFDLCMNFRRDSDVPVFYFGPHIIPLLLAPPKPKTRQAIAVYFASNSFALNNRYELFGELMKYIKIDSCGKSQNNCKLERDTGRMTKLETISSYFFYLAFENSNCVDYVSEKMFDGLLAGTVPVYLGAPNVDEYLPGNNCIIKVSDYPSAADLASHLLDLSKDIERYESYLAWKKEPLRETFLELARTQEAPALRRLCARIFEIRDGNRKPALSENGGPEGMPDPFERQPQRVRLDQGSSPSRAVSSR